jgi:streptomycin 6-kinase
LFRAVRNWVAIDPKGLIGEPEYEVSAALRNPTLKTNVYADAAIIERWVAIAVDELGFDRMRMLGWCFSQAILSSIWALEDDDSDVAICDPWRYGGSESYVATSMNTSQP